jgi:hypothetical protein
MGEMGLLHVCCALVAEDQMKLHLEAEDLAPARAPGAQRSSPTVDLTGWFGRCPSVCCRGLLEGMDAMDTAGDASQEAAIVTSYLLSSWL